MTQILEEDDIGQLDLDYLFTLLSLGTNRIIMIPMITSDVTSPINDHFSCLLIWKNTLTSLSSGTIHTAKMKGTSIKMIVV